MAVKQQYLYQILGHVVNFWLCWKVLACMVTVVDSLFLTLCDQQPITASMVVQMITSEVRRSRSHITFSFCAFVHLKPATTQICLASQHSQLDVDHLIWIWVFLKPSSISSSIILLHLPNNVYMALVHTTAYYIRPLYFFCCRFLMQFLECLFLGE